MYRLLTGAKNARSRTHHYPFRLVPPKTLGDYLQQLCASEGVTLDAAAMPLVVRAGAGSVRDTLSILDQLLGGAGPEGVTYPLAVQLLGYTPDSLLDEAIDAFSATDGATVFGVVDKVIESGQDPRRFAEDLLQRLRDLVVLRAVPDALETGLLEAPGDRADRLRAQAAAFGPAELVRIADITDTALTEFRGATAPRLLLELMCARILVPGGDGGIEQMAARLDRIERRLEAGGASMAAAAPAAPDPAPEPAAPTPTPQPQPQPQPEPAVAVEEPEFDPQAIEPEPEPEPEPAPEPVAASPGQLGVVDIRRLWPEVLEAVQGVRRFAWILLSQNAQVAGLDGDVLTLALVNAGARDSFHQSRSDEVLVQALHQVLGVTWRVETIVDASVSQRAEPEPPPQRPATRAAPKRERVPVPDEVREAMTRPAEASREQVDLDADADLDDPVVDESGEDAEALLSRELGAEVIDELGPPSR